MMANGIGNWGPNGPTDQPADPTVAGSWVPAGVSEADRFNWLYDPARNPGMKYDPGRGLMWMWAAPETVQKPGLTYYDPAQGYDPAAVDQAGNPLNAGWYKVTPAAPWMDSSSATYTPATPEYETQPGHWVSFAGNPTDMAHGAAESFAKYSRPDPGLFDPGIVAAGLGTIAGLGALGGAFTAAAPEMVGLEPTVADLTSGAMLPQSSGALSTLPTAIASTDAPIQLAEAGLSDAPPAYAQTLSTGANAVDPLTYLTEDPMQSIINADPTLSALAPSPTYSLPEGDYYTPDYAFSGSPTGTPYGSAPIGGSESEMLPPDIAREVIPSPTIPNVPGMGDIYAPSTLSALKAVWGTTKDVATVSALIKSLGLTGNAALKLLQQVTGQTQASPLRGALSLLGAGSMLALMNSKPGRPAAAIPGGTSAQGALGRVGFAAPRAANTARLFAQGYARGGSLADRKRAFFNYVRGSGGGQDDTVQANLSPGEYVMDAETVSSLGDGNNEAGAAKLDRFRQAVRQHKRSGPLSDIPPKAKPIEHYLKG